MTPCLVGKATSWTDFLPFQVGCDGHTLPTPEQLVFCFVSCTVASLPASFFFPSPFFPSMASALFFLDLKGKVRPRRENATGDSNNGSDPPCPELQR